MFPQDGGENPNLNLIIIMSVIFIVAGCVCVCVSSVFIHTINVTIRTDSSVLIGWWVFTPPSSGGFYFFLNTVSGCQATAASCSPAQPGEAFLPPTHSKQFEGVWLAAARLTAASDWTRWSTRREASISRCWECVCVGHVCVCVCGNCHQEPEGRWCQLCTSKDLRLNYANELLFPLIYGDKVQLDA